MANKRALLTGNGINQLDSTQAIAWGMLLTNLKNTYDIDADLDNPFKPFPLGFEEMLFRKRGTNEALDKLKRLKRSIREDIERQLLGKLGYNDFHKKIMEVGYNDILTTNYDYCLQKSIKPDFETTKSSFAINRQESKYSLKRGYKIDNCTIWHIHGELIDSRKLTTHSKYYKEESIMIGYEHYTSYLEKIQEIIKGKRKGKETINGLQSRIKNNDTATYWTDKLFTHDVDIIGQGLDFSENHLWWLINYRAAIKNETEYITNKIRFYYPLVANRNSIDSTEIDALDTILAKRNANYKSKAVAEVLEAFDVKTIGITCLSYIDFYNQLIENYL
ncbi:MAG: SIR2 family protein [Flavobacterium sp.]